MNENEVRSEYFNWMYDLVVDRHNRTKSYRRLFHCLDRIQFEYSIPMDGNRESDGINLRYRFGFQNGYEDYEIADILDTRPCSVLEMMIALSIKCEENIMQDPEAGDRIPRWFWDMIHSLGLEGMDDDDFDYKQTLYIIDIFLNREYEPNGAGGLFTLKHPKRDMRNVEIWYQLNWYLDELIFERR